MKRKCAFVLLLCGLVLLSVPGYADYAISVDRDTIDFGTATEGYAQDTYKQTLSVTNTGSDSMPKFMAVLLTGQTTAFAIELGAVYDDIPAGESRPVILKPANNLTPGTYTAVLEAKGYNDFPPSEVKSSVQLTFTVIAAVAPTFTSAASATFTAGTGGSHTFAASGDAPITFAIADALPTGVTLNNGVLTVDNTAAAGSHTLTVTATNAAGSVTQTFTLTVKAKSSGGGSSDDWEPVEDIKSYEQAIVIKCREWANVRSGPSTDTEIVGRVYLGESISLLQWNKDETWCKILYDGDSKMGWLYYKFIKPVK